MTFKTHTIGTAPADSRENLRRVEGKFGFVPNFMGVLAAAPATLEAFIMLNEMMKKTSLSTVERYVVFATVSRKNESPYCMAAHAKEAEENDIPDDLIVALQRGDRLINKKLEALRQYTIGVMKNRGRPSDDVKNNFLEAGYGPQQALEIILGIAVKTISNYTNRLAHTDLDDEFGDTRWQGSLAV